MSFIAAVTEILGGSIRLRPAKGIPSSLLIPLKLEYVLGRALGGATEATGFGPRGLNKAF